MNPRSVAALSALLLAGAVSGQETLVWSDLNSWSNGATTGSYNGLSGVGSAGATINTLTYTFDSGLTATVSATRDGGVSWQNGSMAYNGFAPRVANNGVFALGISGGSNTTGATISIHFSEAITLDSFRIGDLDGSGAQDRVSLSTSTAGGSLTAINWATLAPTITGNGTAAINLLGIPGAENTFGLGAASAWATFSSGGTEISDLTIKLLGGSGAHGVWFDNLAVSTVIPEPSTYALVLGCGTLVVAGLRRRRWSRF